MKIDPYGHKERYQKWKERSRECIKDISKITLFKVKKIKELIFYPKD